LSAPVFIGGDVFRRPAFAPDHPLAIPRVGAVIELCRILGWLDEQNFIDSPRATIDQLRRFHDSDYIAAVQACSRAGTADDEMRRRYGLGTDHNPAYPGLFERTTTACGGSLLAARLIGDGGIAFNPAGGTHHGRPDRARGFCYFNDVALAVLALLDGGMKRVLYVDFDAHHGDGVQDAFDGDERVLTVSIHEGGRWPHSGSVDDRGGGNARNMAVPRGLNDSEFEFLFETAVLPLADRFEPEAVVVIAGGDNLAGDPLARMALTNTTIWRAVAGLVALTPRTLIVGGGGYNPWNVVRGWTGLWGVLSGFDIPDRLPADGETLMRSLDANRIERDEIPEAWMTTLADRPNHGPVRDEVRALPGRVLAPTPGD
jgi:acetoin utilization protein AcuC